MKTRRGPRARFRMPALGIGPQVTIVVLMLGLIGAMAIQPTRQLIEQRRRIDGMAGDLARIQELNASLEARVKRLNDPDFIEQRAREQVGLVRPGETTYVVMPPSRREQKATKERKAAERPPPPPPEPNFVERLLDFVGVG